MQAAVSVGGGACAGGGEKRACSLGFVCSHPMETHESLLQMRGALCLAHVSSLGMPPHLSGALIELLAHSNYLFPNPFKSDLCSSAFCLKKSPPW